jgi:hypothetical protein
MSLNLNCSGKLVVDGPQAPSGLSWMGGSEKDAMVEKKSVDKIAYATPSHDLPLDLLLT